MKDMKCSVDIRDLVKNVKRAPHAFGETDTVGRMDVKTKAVKGSLVWNMR